MAGREYGTAYTETEALLAALEDEGEDLRLKLEEMTVYELLELRHAAQRLRNLCDTVRWEKEKVDELA